MQVGLGAFYLDEIADSADPTTRPTVINRIPEPGETDVPIDSALRLTVVDVGAAGLLAGATRLTVISAAGTQEVWNGVAFHASWAGSTFTAATSDGGGPNDEHRFTLVRDTDFSSNEVIAVYVFAETVDGFRLSTSYQFTIEDLTAPGISTVRSLRLTRVEVQFTESVEQGTGTAGDALRVRRLSNPTLIAPRDLEVTDDTFVAGDVGLHVGIEGATADGANNAHFTVAAVVSARRVTLDADIAAETLPRTATATIGPYRLDGVPDTDGLRPFYTPIVVSAEAGNSADLVWLNLSQELSPTQEYTLTTTQINDLNANQLGTATANFTSEPLLGPTSRSFDVLTMVPPVNLAEDDTGDLERFLRAIHDVAALLLTDVDRFGELLDIDLAPEHVLDVLLYQLGNPFSFVDALTSRQKRALLDVLVAIYKRNGTEAGMEAVLNFFLGVPIDIQPYNGLEGQWELGVSLLGINTVLGTSVQFQLYAFQAESPVPLTAVQRNRLAEIIEYMKPAHTHYVRLIEPAVAPPTPPVWTNGGKAWFAEPAGSWALFGPFGGAWPSDAGTQSFRPKRGV